jgi:hypothetical protein
LDFSAIGGKRQRHGNALIGAGGTGCKAPGLKTPNKSAKDSPPSLTYTPHFDISSADKNILLSPVIILTVIFR